MPKRIQRKRVKGWRMPKGTVYVGRPSKWGNPYDEADYPELTRKELIRNYRRLMLIPQNREIAMELKGKNLACWCAFNQPCHADILLQIANQ